MTSGWKTNLTMTRSGIEPRTSWLLSFLTSNALSQPYTPNYITKSHIYHSNYTLCQFLCAANVLQSFTFITMPSINVYNSTFHVKNKVQSISTVCVECWLHWPLYKGVSTANFAVTSLTPNGFVIVASRKDLHDRPFSQSENIQMFVAFWHHYREVTNGHFAIGSTFLEEANIHILRTIKYGVDAF